MSEPEVRAVEDGRGLLLADAWLLVAAAGALGVAEQHHRENGGTLPWELRRLRDVLNAFGQEVAKPQGDTPLIGALAVQVLLSPSPSGLMKTRDAALLIDRSERTVRRLPSAGRGLVRVEDVVAAAARQGGVR
jgi:hypothetical protein